jgi:peroxiredoxin
MTRPIIAIILIFLSACNTKKQLGTRIVFHIGSGYHKKFYLQNVPFAGEKLILLDSAIAKADPDSLVFLLPASGERLFRIVAPEVDMDIVFITDVARLDIYADYGNTTRYSFQGSPASVSLKEFMDRQDSIAMEGKRISQTIDSAGMTKGNHTKTDSLHRLLNDHVNYSFQQYKNFEDTVNSPAAFMFLYNNLDFGNDYAGLKKFILQVGNRFPHYAPVQQLKEEALAMIKIYEEEYNVGDTLPSISLPDQYGHLFSTASLKGKYYLVDFWSTWCPQCMAYNEPKKAIKKQFSSDVFELVSVAIDAEKESWQKMITQEHLNWPQLIDEKMWQGIAVKTLKFDSIPFNFLVSPQGKIIAKGIRQDSLVSIISKKIKGH